MSRLRKLADEVHEKLNDKSVLLLVGEKTISRNEQRRRIVWDRSGNSSTVQRAQGRSSGKDIGETSRTLSPLDRLESIDVHIYAENESAVDKLFDAFLVALDLVAPTTSGVQSGSYIWTVDENNNERCPKIVLTISVKLPVLDEEKSLTKIVGGSHTCQIVTTL